MPAKRFAIVVLVWVLVMQSLSARAAEVKYFPVQQGDHPHDVAPAPDGKVWYTAQLAGVLGRLDPKTGEVERIPLGEGSAPHGVIAGPDGAAWVTDAGQNAILRIDPRSKEVKAWPLPASRGGANLNTAAFDGRGRIWFTGQTGIYGRLDPATGNMIWVLFGSLFLCAMAGLGLALVWISDPIRLGRGAKLRYGRRYQSAAR